VKAEGHFMRGTASGMYPSGFYTVDNPQGFKTTPTRWFSGRLYF
jgi:hypothetical protein